MHLLLISENESFREINSHGITSLHGNHDFYCVYIFSLQSYLNETVILYSRGVIFVDVHGFVF